MALHFGIRGYVMNQPKGSVYCEAEGAAYGLEAFTDWCAEGSPRSHVASVEVEVKTQQGYKGIEIRH